MGYRSKGAEHRVLLVAGTRAEVIKLAPVALALADLRIDAPIATTGQHPDLVPAALGAFGLDAAYRLDVFGEGQPLAVLQRRIVVAASSLLRTLRPSLVVVQGDTASALGAAIAARAERFAVAHVEAGLRSFDRAQPFPEEINRTLIARLASLHFAPTPGARANLIAEGVPAHAIEVTGNTVIDALRIAASGTARVSDAGGRRRLLVTLHRRENRTSIAAIVEALAAIARRSDVEMVVPVHPSMDRAAFAPLAGLGNVEISLPRDYFDFIGLLASSWLAITDSGGVQEEASALGIPTLIARAVTERPEVVEAGTALIVGTDTDRIVREACRLLDDERAHRRMAQASSRLGDGVAGRRIAGRIQADLMAMARRAA